MISNLPSLLRQARLAAGFSQAKASEYLGYKNRSYVCQIEAGKAAPRRRGTWVDARGIRRTPSWLDVREARDALSRAGLDVGDLAASDVLGQAGWRRA